MVVLPLPGPATVATTVGRRPTASDGDRAEERDIFINQQEIPRDAREGRMPRIAAV